MVAWMVGLMDRYGGRGVVLTLMVFLPGCPGVVSSGGGTGGGAVTDGNVDGTLTSSLGKTSGEPNGAFADAVVAVFDAAGLARLQGYVSEVGDLDVYLLGAVDVGDRLVIDAFADSSSLDISIALFDDKGRMVFENDDRGTSNGFLDSYIDFVARHAGTEYYLVVTHSAFAGSGGYTGSYRVEVERMSGEDVPEPVAQLVLLNFDGGTIDSPSLGRTSIEPFSAEAISATYAGQDDELKAAIRDAVEQNYERFEVTVLSSDDPAPADGTVVTTIHLGGFDLSAFGIAEDVDLYNSDYCDDALIFTESFSPGVFTRRLSVEELGIAIGNVAAHELGHLLGLNHVDDDLDVMDDRSPADAFIEDQEFKESPLSSDIMPIGTLDSALLLSETVGYSELGLLEPSMVRSLRRGLVRGEWIPRRMSRVLRKGESRRR